MGNVSCHSNETPFVSSAMARYMSLSHEQVLSIRDILFPVAATSKHGSINRETFSMAMDTAGVKLYPDQDVLNLLFTLWDLTGNIDNVNCKELCVGISILACSKESTVDDVIAFALNVLDFFKTDMISLKNAEILLQSLNTAALYFGDKLFSRDQIVKIVDNVFDMVSLVSIETDDMAHEKFRFQLQKQNMVRAVFDKSYDKPRYSKTIAAVIDEFAFPVTDRHRSLQSGIDMRRTLNFDPRTHRSPTTYDSSLLTTSRQKPIFDVHSTFDDGATTDNDEDPTVDIKYSTEAKSFTEVRNEVTATPTVETWSCATESTAFKYSSTYDSNMSVLMKPLTRIHIASPSE